MTRALILKSLNRSGITAAPDAVQGLESVLRAEDDPESTMTLLLSKIKAKGKNRLDAAMVNEIVAELSRDDNDSKQIRVAIIDAFDIPRHSFTVSRNRFVKQSDAPTDAATLSAKLLRERYNIIKQKIQRNPKYSRAGNNSNLFLGRRRVQDHPPVAELCEIDSLHGSVRGDKTVLGFLSKLSDGNIYLEDPHAKIILDIHNVKTVDGFITEGCFVICTGRVKEGVFVATEISHPPVEKRSESFRIHSDIDFLTGEDPVTEECAQANTMLRKSAEEAMLVILSDVHIDNPEVLEQLETMFSTFESVDEVPAVFVLMGNFTSVPFGEGEGQCGQFAFKQAWDALAAILIKCPRILKESVFVFIPGPNDPSLGNSKILPRAKIPTHFSKYFTQALLEVEPEMRVHFGTNPCRIRFYDEEIVLFREEMIGRMRRHCLIKPNENESPPTALGRALVQQSHLSPLPQHTSPVMWPFDNSLSLYPLPHVVIAAENYDQYDLVHGGCHFINPGAFCLDFSFVVYYPSSRTCDFSKLTVPEGDTEMNS